MLRDKGFLVWFHVASVGEAMSILPLIENFEKQKKIDSLFIDTAGRVQNKKELMDELAKIIRVIRKLEPNSPHHCLLTLDATTGQNAINQVEIFKEIAEITGLGESSIMSWTSKSEGPLGA